MAAKILLQIWKSWKQDFILFMADTKYDEKPDNVKSGLLLHNIGKAREVRSWFNKIRKKLQNNLI